MGGRKGWVSTTQGWPFPAAGFDPAALPKRGGSTDSSILGGGWSHEPIWAQLTWPSGETDEDTGRRLRTQLLRSTSLNLDSPKCDLSTKEPGHLFPSQWDSDFEVLP